jgi:hypothetical protein
MIFPHLQMDVTGAIALGAGSEANGGGDALNGCHTHPGCDIAVGPQCFNEPGR